MTGGFKITKDFFYVPRWTVEEKKRDIATCSAGNHGIGIAYAAKELDKPCTVFVPKSVDQAKHEKLITNFKPKITP